MPLLFSGGQREHSRPRYELNFRVRRREVSRPRYDLNIKRKEEGL